VGTPPERVLRDMKEEVVTRRDFLRAAAGAAMAATLAPELLGEARAEQTAKVVLIRNREVLGDQGRLQSEILQSMLDEAVKTLLGTNNPWKAGGSFSSVRCRRCQKQHMDEAADS